MKITIVGGARPNFIKIAPIIKAVEDKIKEGRNISYRLVHTGQHYDEKMSGSFFKELNITTPNINLEVKGGTTIQQIAANSQVLMGEARIKLESLTDGIIQGDLLKKDYKPEIQRVVVELQTSVTKMLDSIKNAIEKAK